MSRESILKIRETEAAAAEQIADAKARAQAMLEAAEQEGNTLCESTERDARTKKAAVLSELKQKCEQLAEKSQAETEDEIVRLRREVGLRRKIAEKIIIRGLESKCR